MSLGVITEKGFDKEWAVLGFLIGGVLRGSLPVEFLISLR